MKEIRAKAKELMKGSCRVCPACDGRVCAGEVPGMGGLGTGSTFRNNFKALQDVTLNMSVLHGAKIPSTATTWLGLELALPVVASPIGGMFNFNNPISEAEYCSAIINGCKARGAIGCTGDGVPPELMDSGLAAISAAGGHGIPFVKPWDGEELEDKMTRAIHSGAPVIGSDIDAAGLITLRKMGRPVSPKTPFEIAEMAELVHRAGRKFIVKGIMTSKDAIRAVDAGADCIVVTNHGGRVLDHAPGTAQVLRHIAEAVKGRVSIMVDGGVRDGIDVLKMLALGADIVGIGRPFSVAAIGGGADGVSKYLDSVKTQLEQGMVLTGCATIGEIEPSILFAG